MGNCCSSSDTDQDTDSEPTVPTPEKTQSPQEPQPTSIPDRTTSIPSPRPSKAISVRARAQSQGAALSRRHHDDDRDYPPPSSGGDVFTSQHPDRQEMRSRQHPSGGTGRMQRTRAVSMDVVTNLLSAPPHLSRLRNRTASMTSQITAGRQGGRSRFPFALQSLLPNDFKYAVRRCPISP
jgi:hypothetical protein